MPVKEFPHLHYSNESEGRESKGRGKFSTFLIYVLLLLFHLSFIHKVVSLWPYSNSYGHTVTVKALFLLLFTNMILSVLFKYVERMKGFI